MQPGLGALCSRTAWCVWLTVASKLRAAVSLHPAKWHREARLSVAQDWKLSAVLSRQPGTGAVHNQGAATPLGGCAA
eukprot:scaffold22146_cov69-Phaeocystis_antarctica.AAC.1